MNRTNKPDVNVLDQYLDEYGPISFVSSCGQPKYGPGEYPKDTRAAKAYEVALDIRKFEIELYWKRAGYFWLLLAALTTALGLLLTAKADVNSSLEKHREVYAFVVSCAAAVLSLCWALVNYSSKFWQTNWELQVDVLEDRVLGPLYKTVMRGSLSGSAHKWFSVSDINLYISIYFAGAYLFACTYFGGLLPTMNEVGAKWAIFVANLFFLGFMFSRITTGRDSKDLVQCISYTRRRVRHGERTDAPNG